VGITVNSTIGRFIRKFIPLFRQSYVTVVPSPVDLAGSDSLLERVQLQLVGFVLIVATAGEKENITNFAN